MIWQEMSDWRWVRKAGERRGGKKKERERKGGEGRRREGKTGERGHIPLCSLWSMTGITN